LARWDEHVMQKPPFVPHACGVGGETQFTPEQQPDEQLASLHLQTPPTHSWPDGHAARPPQVHTPLPEQPSAV
jgi:hypothetical protein